MVALADALAAAAARLDPAAVAIRLGGAPPADAAAGDGLLAHAAATLGLSPAAAAAEFLDGGFDLDGLTPGERAALAGALADESAAALALVTDDPATDDELMKAIGAAEKALRIDPESPAANMASGATFAARGEMMSAADGFLAAADILGNAGDMDGADAALARGQAACPTIEDIPLARARIAEARGLPDAAVTLMREVADTRRGAGREADNLGVLKRLSELAPADADIRMRLAALHEGRRDMRTAGREMEKAAQLMVAQGRGAEAVPVLERVLEIEPQMTRLRMSLVDRLVESGDIGRARGHLIHAVSGQVENSEFVAAAQTVRRWLEAEPDSADAREWMGRVYQEQGMGAEAAAELRAAATLCRAADDEDRAMGYLFRAKFAYPEDDGLRRELVALLEKRGETQRAAFELFDLAEVLFARGAEASPEAAAALRDATRLDTGAATAVQVAVSLRTHAMAGEARTLLGDSAKRFAAAGDEVSARECLEAALEGDAADADAARGLFDLLTRTVGLAAAVGRGASLAAGVAGGGDPAAAADLLSAIARRISTPPTSVPAEGAGIPSDEPEGPLSPADAAALFDAALAVGPAAARPARFFYSVAMEDMKSRDPRAAYAMARAMRALAPEFEGALRDIASLGEAAGEPEKAGEALVELAGLAEAQQDWYTAADCLLQASMLLSIRAALLKRRAELMDRAAAGAVDDTERAGAAESAAAAWRDWLERIRRVDSPEEALAAYDRHLDTRPEDDIARRGRAEVLVMLGRRQEAGTELEAIAVRAAAHGEGETLADALEALTALRPADTRLRADLGAALAALGQTAKAAELLASASADMLAADDVAGAARAARAALAAEDDSPAALQALVEAERRLSDPDALADALSRLAISLLNRERPEDAIVPLRELITVDPADPVYRRRLAWALELMGEEETLGAWLEAAEAHTAAGQHKQALEVFDVVRDRIGGDPSTLDLWARAAEAAGDRERRCIALTTLGATLTGSGEYGGARRALDRLRDTDAAAPTLGPALRRLASARAADDAASAGRDFAAASDAFLARGLDAEAAECLKAAADADGDEPETHQRLIRFHQGRGDETAAFAARIPLLRALVTRGTEAQWRGELDTLRCAPPELLPPARRLAVARILLATGRRVEAGPDLARVVADAIAADDHALVVEACDADPRSTALSPELRSAKADALLALGKPDIAAAWLKACAETALRDGRPDEAEELTRRWNDLTPADPEAMGMMAGIHMQRQDTHLAYETSLAQANFQWATGEFDKAVDAIQQAIRADPHGLDAWRTLAQIQQDSGRPAEAADAMQRLAELLLASGDEREAYETLKQLVALRPDSIDALRLMTRIVHRHRGFERALRYARRLLNALRNAGMVDEADREYREIIELDGAPAELRLEYADYLELLGRRRDSKNQYLAAARQARDQANDFALATKLFAKASEEPREPEDADALEELAVMRHVGRMAGQAATALREASRLHEARGFPERAIDCLERAMQMVASSSRPADLADVARLQLRAGRRREAADTLRRALSTMPAASAGDASNNEFQAIVLRLQLQELDPMDMDNVLALVALLPPDDAGRRAVESARRLMAAGRRADHAMLVEKALKRAPEDLALHAEWVAARRRSEDGSGVRQALEGLCRAAAANGETGVARAALRQMESLPAEDRDELSAAPLHALVGETAKAVEAYCAAAWELLGRDELGPAIDAVRHAMDVQPAAVPAALVAALLRQSAGSRDARDLALGALGESVARRARLRATVIGGALLQVLEPADGIDFVTRLAEKAGGSLATAVTASHVDWLIERRQEPLAARLAHALAQNAYFSADAWALAAQALRGGGEPQLAAEAGERAATLAADVSSVTEDSGLQAAEDPEPDDEAALETMAGFFEREHRIGDAIRTYRKLASIASARGDERAAAERLRAAAEAAPGDADLRSELAERLVKAGRPALAAAPLREAAKLWQRRGDPAKARSAAARATALAPDDEAAAELCVEFARKADDREEVVRRTVALGGIQERSADPARAVTTLMAALGNNPDHPDLLRALASASRTAGAAAPSGQPAAEAPRGSDSGRYRNVQDPPPSAAFTASVSRFEMLHEIRPDDLDVLDILVNACATEGMEHRRAMYEARLSEQALASGDAERARAVAADGLARNPGDAPMRRRHGDALHALGRTVEAVGEWVRAAEEMRDAGDPEAALDSLRRATVASPHNRRAMRAYADALAAAGRTNEASRAYQALTENLASAGEIRYADTAVRRLKNLDPDDPIVHERAYSLERRAGRRASALEELLWLVRFHVEQGNRDSADRMLAEGADLDAGGAALLDARIDVERQLGTPESLRAAWLEMTKHAAAAGDRDRVTMAVEAIRAEAAATSAPFKPSVHAALGEALLAVGERGGAYSEFTAAVQGRIARGSDDSPSGRRADTPSSMAHNAPAAPGVESHAAGSTGGSARALADSLLRKHPGLPDLYAALAEPFAASGDTATAATYFAAAATLAAGVGDSDNQLLHLRRAVECRPGWGEGLRQLADGLAASGDRDGALTALATLENLLSGEGRTDEATDALRRQTVLSPDDAALRARLADAYEAAGDTGHAAEVVEEIAEISLAGGHAAAAVEACRRLVRLRPNDPAALQRFAELLDRAVAAPPPSTGSIDAAHRQDAEAVTAAAVVEAYNQLADAYLNRGAIVQAGEILARILGIDPTNDEARDKFMALQA